MSIAMGEILFGIYELYETILKGINHLVQHPDNPQLWTDVGAGMAALRENADGTGILTEDLRKTFIDSKNVFSAGSPDISALTEVKNQLSRFLPESVAKGLSQTLREVPDIPAPLAEKIFRFYDKAPHTGAVYQVLFDTCGKAGIKAPYGAFEYALKLFEEQPGIFSGEKMPHPGYVYRPAEQRTFESCPVCGGAGVPYYSVFSYFMADFQYPYLPVKLWMKCGGCGNLYTWKHPEEFLARIEHQEMIFPNPERSRTAVQEANQYIFAVWSGILNKLKAYTTGKSLLEVGIGKGELLAAALEMGYDVDAVEIVSAAAQKIADILDIPIWNGDFLRYSADKSYSIIIMGDVIEHVLDPEAALRNAYRLLDEQGVLWLSTPNFESAFSRMKKFSDPMWLEPGHISYFSYRGLEPLLHKCGFEVREYLISRRYNGSMELILTKKREQERFL